MICLENKVQYEVSQDIYKGKVLFKSLKNCKRRNKGNFTLKSN